MIIIIIIIIIYIYKIKIIGILYNSTTPKPLPKERLSYICQVPVPTMIQARFLCGNSLRIVLSYSKDTWNRVEKMLKIISVYAKNFCFFLNCRQSQKWLFRNLQFLGKMQDYTMLSFLLPAFWINSYIIWRSRTFHILAPTYTRWIFLRADSTYM